MNQFLNFITEIEGWLRIIAGALAGMALIIAAVMRSASWFKPEWQETATNVILGVVAAAVIMWLSPDILATLGF